MFSVLFLLLPLLYYSDGDPSSDAIQISESAIIMTGVKSLTCYSDVNLSRFVGRMVVYHEWNQAYHPGNCSAMKLPSIEAFSTKYTVEFHKFDNNTNINSMISVYNASNGLAHVFNYALDCSVSQRKWISLVDADIYRYQVDHIFTYVGSVSKKISCTQYLHLSNLLEIQIGWITTAGDKIFTYKQTEIILNLSEVYNGSMVCCLYYTTTAYKDGKHIQRFVKDKTLLIYQKETLNSSPPTSTTTESYCENEGNRNITASATTTPFITDTSSATGKNSNTTNKTDITSGTANETDQKTNNTNTTDKTTSAKERKETKIINTKHKQQTNITTNNKTQHKHTNATNRTDSSNHDADTDYVIIIISSITAILVLLLVGICAIRRHYLKKINRPKRAQLPLPQIPGARLRPAPANEPDSNTPFYLNLLFRRECELEIQAREEPHYEEVIYQ